MGLGVETVSVGTGGSPVPPPQAFWKDLLPGKSLREMFHVEHIVIMMSDRQSCHDTQTQESKAVKGTREAGKA